MNATKRICQVDGCTNILKKTEGRICQMHRSRKFRNGNYNISPKWPNLKKGIPCLTKNGYNRICIDGKRILEHRYIMEKYLGRKLTEKERIHHINGNKIDNRIENLELTNSNSQHLKKYHADTWKRRKINGELTPDAIHNIIDRYNLPKGTYIKCFCGNDIKSRNLCHTHYQWAYRHKLF